MKKLVFLLGILMVFSGCGGTKEITPIQELKEELDAPDWVVKGSGAFKSDKGKVFYGVGSATDIGNPSLLRTTADDRARNELAKIFETYTSSITKDYIASTSKPGADSSAPVAAEEQHVEIAIKTVTAMTLNGAEIIDRWQNPDSGELFSLARIDVEAMKNVLGRVKDLSEPTREYIRKNAERLHEELIREEEKMKNR